MKRKAFTLIELLAVIVIIAVIALITVPLVINVIEKSQRNAFIDSAYGIIEAGKLYYVENIDDKQTVKRYDFKINDKKFIWEEDATTSLSIWSGTAALIVPYSIGNTNDNYDYFYQASSRIIGFTGNNSYSNVGVHTSRPTNTSVLYCIKYK